MSDNNNDHLRVDASPTKEFFITILVRDITLSAAISELVDNSVDGAKLIRQDHNFSGLSIHIEFGNDRFEIRDNCGGISTDTARNYAFKFGRAEGRPSPHNPIGQFGVGMKRALFKLGTSFSIESTAPDSRFVLNVDVNKWKTETLKDDKGREKWAFEFTECQEGLHNDIEECGTNIVVQPLLENIAEELELGNFQNRLIDSIRFQQMEALQKGLKITVNDIPLHPEEVTLLQSAQISPYFVAKEIQQNGLTIKTRIYAGISDVSKEKSGWYVFCNGRLVLRADKTRATGWDEKIEIEESEITTPKSHYQFARFRGFVYFDADAASASLLPWNTTKSGIDVENPIYQSVKQMMIIALRQVIDFLNRLDAELDSGETFLENIINESASVRLSEIAPNSKFTYPPRKPPQEKPKNVRISYTRPYDQFEMAKDLLGVSSAKEVGARTFEYFLQMEGDDANG